MYVKWCHLDLISLLLAKTFFWLKATFTFIDVLASNVPVGLLVFLAASKDLVSVDGLEVDAGCRAACCILLACAGSTQHSRREMETYI